MKLAIIGTAGRDKTMPHTIQLWAAMCNHLARTLGTIREELPRGETITAVSGGAAWADHLAIWAWHQGLLEGLTVHLPAPWARGKGFYDARARCGSVSNYHHGRFSQIIQQNTLAQIEEAAMHPDTLFTEAPATNDLSQFFVRNSMVVEELTGPHDAMLAYTWGRGNVPADGGTNDTWNKFRSQRKLHIPLFSLN